jgi:transcription elongation factor GreA
MEKVPMTTEGLAPLQDELRRLKSEERPAIIKAISEAREHGDLSENAEYHAAKERQGFVEGRIQELEDIISRADVIDVSKLSGSTVKFGATVTVADEDTDEEVTYQIVGPYEADLAKKRISIQSPIARALIGKSVGESTEVKAPGGIKGYEVIDIKYK